MSSPARSPESVRKRHSARPCSSGLPNPTAPGRTSTGSGGGIRVDRWRFQRRHGPRSRHVSRNVPPAPAVGLTVAVGAEEREVLEAVVVALAVDVVQLERERGIAPFGDAALLARSFLQARGD